MLDSYASKLNDIVISIYDSVQRVEEQMLSKSVPQPFYKRTSYIRNRLEAAR